MQHFGLKGQAREPKPFTFSLQALTSELKDTVVNSRCGVEDPTFKAEDSKKSESKDQLSKQTLSRPRTEMFEAKDQGQISQMVSEKIFFK